VPGIGVIINPHARANRNGGAERARRLAEIVGGDGTVRVTESLPAIQDVAREFRERGTEVLAICGGDGSYHCTLTGFRSSCRSAPAPSTTSRTRSAGDAAARSRRSPASCATIAGAASTRPPSATSCA